MSPRGSSRSSRSKYSRIHARHTESSTVDKGSHKGLVHFSSHFGWRYDSEDLSTKWWELPVYILIYTLLFVDLSFGLFYLIYVWIILSERTMNWDYTPIEAFQSHNTWSIIGPWLLVILSILIIYKLYTKGRIKDGDFQGILGWYLLVSIIMVFEGYSLWEVGDDLSGNRTEAKYKELEFFMINGAVEAEKLEGRYDLPDWLQEDYKCCGVKGSQDWSNVPKSCSCQSGSNCAKSGSWDNGCAEILWDRLGPICIFVAGLHWACASLLVINSIIFLFLFKAMKLWEKRKKEPGAKIIGLPRDLLMLKNMPKSVLEKQISSSSDESDVEGQPKPKDIKIDIGPQKESFIHYFPEDETRKSNQELKRRTRSRRWSKDSQKSAKSIDSARSQLEKEDRKVGKLWRKKEMELPSNELRGKFLKGEPSSTKSGKVPNKAKSSSGSSSSPDSKRTRFRSQPQIIRFESKERAREKQASPKKESESHLAGNSAKSLDGVSKGSGVKALKSSETKPGSTTSSQPSRKQPIDAKSKSLHQPHLPKNPERSNIQPHPAPSKHPSPGKNPQSSGGASGSNQTHRPMNATRPHVTQVQPPPNKPLGNLQRGVSPSKSPPRPNPQTIPKSPPKSNPGPRSGQLEDKFRKKN